jgi:hypothetical protein
VTIACSVDLEHDPYDLQKRATARCGALGDDSIPGSKVIWTIKQHVP